MRLEPLLHWIKKDDKYGVIIGELFNYVLNGNSMALQKESLMNPYIYDTFRCFVEHKTRIEIHLGDTHANTEDKALIDLLFYELKADGVDYSNNHESDSGNSEYRNLLRPRVFQVFPNIEQIYIIVSGRSSTGLVYPFSLLLFLDMIKDTLVKQIRLRSLDKQWLGDLEAQSEFVPIASKYKEMNFEMEFEDQNNGSAVDLFIKKK